MNAIDTATQAYPLTAGDVVSRNPHISFPVPFALPDGYAWVREALPPSFDPITQAVAELAPKKLAGAWTQHWEVRALDAATVAANRAAASAQLLASVQEHAQTLLDAFARERRYDGIVSLSSYATSKNPVHAAEAQRGVDLRDAVWSVLKRIEAEVLAGTRAMPSFTEAVAELPALTWG